VVPGKSSNNAHLYEKPPFIFPSRESKSERVQSCVRAVDKAQSRLNKARDVANFVPELEELDVGKFGTWNYQFTVLQVIGPAEMLASVQGQTVLIMGLSTQGVVDGLDVRSSGLFEVSGTQTYETALGLTNTVLVFKTLDLKAARPIMDKLISEAVAADKRLRMRTWSDRSGKHSVDAVFVEYKGGKVRLEKAGGKLITLPLSRLSTAD